MNTYQDLSIVIPAYNEVEGIARTLDNVSANFPGAEIIVVDDGSIDGTAKVVEAYAGITMIRHGFNRGYGGALKTGMAAGSRPLVAWFDADNEHRVEDLDAMVSQMREGRVAAVIGQRTSSSVTALRGVGKFVIRLLALSLGFRGERDMNCGLRVFRKDVILRYLPLLPNGYSASTTSLLVMLERGYPIGYQHVGLNKRVGSSKVTVKAGFATLLLVMRVIMLFAPMRIFLPSATALFVLGTFYSLVIAISTGGGFPVFGVFLLLAGLLIGMLGLIADQISQMRLTQYETVAPAAVLPQHGQ